MNIGTITATLGVNVSGVVNAQNAMLNLQRQTLKSVTAMNSALNTLNNNLQKTAGVASATSKTTQVAVSSMAQRIADLSTSIAAGSQRLRTFGYLASAVVTLPIIMMGKAIFNASKDFEYSMNKIVSLVGLARPQVQAMTEEVLKMARATGRAPQELADALYFITSAGFKDPIKALDILNTSAKAASVGLGETKDVVNLVTSAMNAYADSNLTSAKAMDIIVAAVREGKIEADGFNSAMQQVIPIASALGIKFEEVAGTMAAMSLQGASASNSAVYLKGMLNSLLKIKPGSAADKALQKFGITAGNLLEDLKRPDGLMGVLIKLRDISDKATGNMFLKSIFRDIRAMTGALSLTGENLEYNKKVIESVRNSYGSLAKANADTADTIQRRMDKATAILNSNLITLGKTLTQAVMPIIEKWVAKLESLTKWFNALDESMQRTIIKTIAFVAALGPLALLGSFIGYTVSGIINLSGKIGRLIGLVGDLTGGFSSMRRVLTNHPLFGGGLLHSIRFLANPYVAAGVALTSVIGLLIHFKKKTEEAALAQIALNTTMTNVNGELKKMKDLTEIDYAAMNEASLTKTNAEAWSVYNKAKANIQAAYARSGMSQEDILKGKKAGKYEGYISQEFAIMEMAKRTIEQTDLATIKLYRDLMMQEDSKKKSFIAKAGEDAKQTQEDMNKVWEDLQDNLRFIDQKSKLLSSIGIAFDADKEKMEAFSNAMDGFVKGGLSEMDSRLKSVTKSLGEFNKLQQTAEHQKFFKEFEEKLAKSAIPKPAQYAPDYSKLLTARKGGYVNEDTAFMSKFNEEIDLLTLKNKVLGDSYNTLRDKISYSKQMLTFLWDEGLRPGMPLMDEMSQNLMNYVYTAEKAEVINNALANSFVDMAGMLGASFVDVKAGMMGMVDIVLQSAQQIVAALLSIAIARKLADPKVALPGGLIFAAIGIGALMALWDSWKGKLDDAAKMAGGGIVPPGYPNDTYPALLSSGERVTPPGKLNDVEFGGTVEFRIKDDYLYGILERRRRRVNSYS